MPLILPGNVATATASTTYEVANSCRFDDGDQSRMNRDLVTATSRQKFTYSFWVKRSTISHQFFVTNSGSTSHIKFDASHRLDFMDEDGNIRYITNRLFRDVSAWYSIIIAVDTTQGVAGNRVKIYVNGTQETSFSTSTAPDQNYNCTFNTAVNFKYGSYDNDADFNLDGYLAEVVFIDGSQEAATSFGEFDSDSPQIWKPKDPSGLTFGTNGHYLDFEASGNLGNDANGGTDWTEANLAATDQSTDTCTLNYSTMNPLDDYYGGHTFSQGNLKVVTPSGNSASAHSTFGLSIGRLYAEVKLRALGSNQTNVGFSANQSTSTGDFLGNLAHQYGYYNGNGKIYNNADSGTSYGGTYAQGEIVGMYLDLEDNKIYFSIDGTLQNSGTGHTITAAASTDLGAYFFAVQHYDNSTAATYDLNFGGTSTFTISSAVSDDNGHGSFEFSPNITGDGSAKKFYAVNSKNLAEFG